MVRATRPNELTRQFLTNHIDPEAKPAFGVRSLAATVTVAARERTATSAFPAISRRQLRVARRRLLGVLGCGRSYRQSRRAGPQYC